LGFGGAAGGIFLGCEAGAAGLAAACFSGARTWTDGALFGSVGTIIRKGRAHLGHLGAKRPGLTFFRFMLWLQYGQAMAMASSGEIRRKAWYEIGD
jgi:hypothetical protein